MYTFIPVLQIEYIFKASVYVQVKIWFKHS